MLKYFHIIKFLMTHDLTKLKEFWEVDFIYGDFSWRKVITRIIKNEYKNFHFWWRLANEMFLYGNENQRNYAHKINRSLVRNYNVDIGLGAKIGKNLSIAHYVGIVITDCAEIGDNCHLVQNVSIALKNLPENCPRGFLDYSKERKIKIGDNVSIGTGTVILAENLTIGNNVLIGAMSFINKDIPDNCTVYTEKTNIIKIKAH